MQKIDMIVKAPHMYTMEGEGVGYRGAAAMAIDRGTILAVGDEREIGGAYTAEEAVDLPHHAVFPGFVDGHMHTGDCILRGLAQDTGYWMMYGLQPFMNGSTDKQREAGSRLAILEAVRSGTTTLGDYENNMDPVCRFIERIGARGNITATIREAKRRTYKPGELYEFERPQGEQALRENLELYDRWHNRGHGRIRILFGPQGADFVSKELLLRIQRLAKERKTKIHMHVQQGDRETWQMVQRYGKRPVGWLAEAGLLDESLIAVHLTDANEEEAALVARSGASMLLCSGSIGIIDGIVPPAKVFQENGGAVGLGSDQAPGNNCHSIINEMKLTALFNKIKFGDPEIMPAWKALRMATVEGARAIGMDDITGSLEAGKKADFIAVDLRTPTMSPVFVNPMRNMVPNLVYSARGEEISLVAVDGRILVRDGRALTVDQDQIVAEAQRYAEPIGKASEKEFWEIHGTNAVFMEEGKL